MIPLDCQRASGSFAKHVRPDSGFREEVAPCRGSAPARRRILDALFFGSKLAKPRLSLVLLVLAILAPGQPALMRMVWCVPDWHITASPHVFPHHVVVFRNPFAGFHFHVVFVRRARVVVNLLSPRP